jgi:hypothetical protein
MSETADSADARVQTIRQCGGNDLRTRAGDKIKNGQFKIGKLGGVQCDDDGTVERGTRSLSLVRNHSTKRSLIDLTVGLSLHQNPYFRGMTTISNLPRSSCGANGRIPSANGSMGGHRPIQGS